MTARRSGGTTVRGADARGRSAAPVVLPAATHHALSRSAESLREALGTTDVPTRYACAHVAALRAAAALLAARARPTTAARRRQKNAWVLLAEVAPEMGEWATFFAAGASTYAAAQAGSRRAATAREADDLVRDADRFLAVVETSLGLFPHAWSDDDDVLRAGVA
ncbi:SAV_6107 family HEPN domain-containing protein [Nocardioides alkalitolerans]|uniref:SAV_6107 family HEPN domain-containing protein n=1 Tax=Nocardioides alkalitolerans TaxID=281714 RepID=UPI00041A4D97|nr:SAV_6107 family HEPN domain-containing protein [Nocardioides alkalitolerans]